MAEVAEDPNSLMSDHSFVILGQGSLTLELNDAGLQSMGSQPFSLRSGNHLENGSTNGDSETGRSFALPSTSSIGIQLKLDKLVKENLLLKETLNQSNLAMKNQFDTLALWHEEVVKTHESHKQKFQETQDQIFKLRNENIGLKKLIQQNLERYNGNSSAIVNLDNEGSSSSVDMLTDVNCKEVNFHYIYIEELRLKNTELERRLHYITEEKLNLEKKLERLAEENNRLKADAESKNEKCTEVQGAKSFICNKSTDNNVEKEYDLKSLDPDILIIDELSRSIEAELDVSDSKAELAELKKQFAKQSEMLQENSDKLENMKMLYEEVLRERDDLKNELKQARINIEEEKAQTESLTRELKSEKELLSSKFQELELGKKEIQKLMLDCEEVAFLRAQVEVYQNDFNEERKAREEAISAKEKMAEQVRLLERSLNDIRKNEERKSLASFEEPGEKAENRYTCPKCFKRFRTLPECENHVYECLDSDIFP